MNIESTDRLILKQVYPAFLNFEKMFKAYCREHGLPETFKDFLWHGHTGFVSKTYRFLLNPETAPRDYLANSKAFHAYYKSLDQDFQKDIMTVKEFNQLKDSLQRKHSIQTALKRLMGRDSIL